MLIILLLCLKSIGFMYVCYSYEFIYIFIFNYFYNICLL
ncbi:hypothetical protein B4092_4789 [Bacillus licheniformis]|nr:hypothetical protein B4092_4789 [Bacillus licheniformis]